MSVEVESVPRVSSTPVVNDANDTVTSTLDTIVKAAESALETAEEAIANMNVSGPALDLGKIVVEDIENISGVEIPEMPAVEKIDVEKPAEMNSDTVSISVEKVPVEGFSATKPDINFPSEPTISEPRDPGEAPAIDTSVNLPAAPDVNLNAILAKLDRLVDTSIPSFGAAPEISIPVWDDRLKPININAPGSVFAYTEDAYQSDIVEALKRRLLKIIETGGTGLSGEVENMIWERAKDRLRDEHEKRVAGILDRYAGSGWHIPGGAMSAEIQYANNERFRSLENANADIMAEQGRLALQSFQHATEKAIALEETVCGMVNSIRDRALRAAVAASEDLERVYQLKVVCANYELDRYKTEASVYEARLRAEVEKLSVYKAQIEAVRAQIEVRAINADLVTKQIDAVDSAMKAYTAQIQGALAKVELEKTRLEAFRTRIDIYNAKWSGITAKIGLYQARLAGERTKADIYKTEADAYASYVQGRATVAEVNARNADVHIRSIEAGIAKQRISLERYKADADISIAAASASGQIFTGKMQGYAAQVNGVIGAAEVSSRISQAQAQNAVAKAQIAAEQMRSSMSILLQKHNIDVEKMRAIAQVSAQLAASIYSGVNVGASISNGHSSSVGVSYSHSESLSNSLSLSESHVVEE